MQKNNWRFFVFYTHLTFGQILWLYIVWELAIVNIPKAKSISFWMKNKFEKFLFEVFPNEAVDEKVDGGVEHERQLVDRGDCQPNLPGSERIQVNDNRTC